MIRIAAISGSLRAKSYNTGLLRAGAALVPAGTTLDVLSIDAVPLYSGDIEARAFPSSVSALKEGIATADGLLLATPEYNGSLPGVLKNAIDWMTRPPEDKERVFGARPVALMGATTSGFGTVLSQSAWLPVLKKLRMRPWFGGLLTLSRADTVFDPDAVLTDEHTRQVLKDFLDGFVRFIEAGR